MATIPKMSGKVIVGVSFDHGMERVVKTVVELFHVSNPDIVLVHVIAPSMDHMLDVAVEHKHSAMAKAMQVHRQHTALVRLERLASTLRRSLEVNVSVIRGEDVAHALVGFAKEQGGDLLVLGSAKAKSLMTACDAVALESIPVMVLHEDSHLVDFTSTHRIFVSDDLAEGGIACIQAAFKLRDLLGSGDILHTHVMSAMDCVRHASSDPSCQTLSDSSERVAHVLTATEEKLRKRFAASTGYPIAQGAASDLWECYDQEITIGQVVEELQRSAVSFRADIAVFAEHRIFHKRLGHGGTVPIKEMLAHDRVVVIAPVSAIQ